jgi:hypothetical protein
MFAKRWWKCHRSAEYTGLRYLIRFATTNVASSAGTARIRSGKNSATTAAVLRMPWIATHASSSPSRFDPASPMKIDAGWKLCQRKPTEAPAVSAARMAASSRPGKDSAMIAKVPAAIVHTPAARPSAPSVKFTTFITATIPTSVRALPAVSLRAIGSRNGSVRWSTNTPAETGIAAAAN